MDEARLSRGAYLPPDRAAVVTSIEIRPLTMLFIIVFIPVRSNPPGRVVS
jgi:hypothetical protein